MLRKYTKIKKFIRLNRFIKTNLYYILLTLLFLPLLNSCGHFNTPKTLEVTTNNHHVIFPKKSVTIDIKNSEKGKDIYTIITDVLGKKAIESPDLYKADHTNVKHIYEAHDDEVGKHFVMSIHRDLDGNKGIFTGRQRNEFKVYGNTSDELKGFNKTTFEYTWKMKINKNMEVSRKFTHFFQLKPKGGEDGTPTFTITGAERRGKDVLEIRYQVPNQDKKTLATIDWETVRGQWLNIYLKATFSDNGNLVFSINQLHNDTELISLNITDIDLWIGENNKHYQRPKWGIVRSLEDLDNLRPDEETVSFANIKIKQL